MNQTFHRALDRRQRGQRGFTLIELLVVIAVLAILAGIVIFNVIGITNRGQTSACVTDLKTVQSASDTYYSVNKQYATAGGDAGDLIQDDLSPTYVHSWPDDGQTWKIDASGTVTNVCTN